MNDQSERETNVKSYGATADADDYDNNANPPSNDHISIPIHLSDKGNEAINHWHIPTHRRSYERLFSEVRSEDDEDEIAITSESALYAHHNPWQRAMPERCFALCCTLLLEIPVLFMVSGGSDSLCQLIGRRRYALLIGFLPLTSAISGNVGLQASTLTTRAISHEHVTMKDYGTWLAHEVAAAAYLGCAMGILMGTIAWLAAEHDVAFGLTIAVAQVLSIITAGLTGTLAPLFFSFVFHRDSGKWGGPLETAVQDIVGSFAMVVVSYHILRLLGPGPIDASDVCGPTTTVVHGVHGATS